MIHGGDHLLANCDAVYFDEYVSGLIISAPSLAVMRAVRGVSLRGVAS